MDEINPPHGTRFWNFHRRAVVYLAPLFVVFSVVLLSPPVYIGRASFGLDPSYQIGLLHALQQHLTFGTEYIFPYGPLAFLMSRIAPPEFAAAIFISDAALIVALIQFFLTITRRSNSLLVVLALPFAVVPPCNDIFFYSAVIVWFALMGFYLSEFMRFRRTSSLLLVCAISIHLLYLKLNLGLVSVPVTSLFLGFCVVREKNKRFFLAVCGGFAFALAMSAYALHVAIRSYFQSGWHLADGFNDAMYLDPVGMGFATPFYCGLAAVGLYALTLLIKVRRICSDQAVFVSTLFTSILLYLIFKQAFVRADGHALIFLQFAPLAIAPLFLLDKKTFGIYGRITLGIITILSCMTYPERYAFALVTDKLGDWSRYYAAALAPAPEGIPPMPREAQLPERLVSEIGTQSVDIIPWETSFLYFNRLAYDPRPIFQSYQAYDPYLDGRNAAFFMSERAPQFVIFMDNCVDDRYCFADETQTKLALVKRYQVRDRVDAFLLLEKRAVPLTFKRETIAQGRVELGQLIRLGAYPDSLLLISLDVRHSLIGGVRRILFQPPPLRLHITGTNGFAKEFRGITPILRGGFIGGSYVENIAAAQTFFEGNFKNLPQISSIKVTSNQAYAFRSPIRYQVERLVLQRLNR